MGRPKITLEEFQRRMKERFPEEKFEVLQYDSLGKYAEIKCCNCNHIIKVNKASNFFAKNRRYGCVNCNGFWIQREKKLNKIKTVYDIIDTFVKDTHTHYSIKCKKCGHIRTATLNNLINNFDCGCITGYYKNRTPEEFIATVNDATCDNYELIGEYKNQTTKVKVRHACGLIIDIWPHDAVDGKISCPHCDRQRSRGERYINNYLRKQNIDFEQEHILYKGGYQRFDFYLEKDNLKCAIEYQGEQHYKENHYFKPSLKMIQERDETKRLFCQKNGVMLYEIPYTIPFSQVKKILDGIINKFNDYPNGVDSSESKSCLSIDYDGQRYSLFS